MLRAPARTRSLRGAFLGALAVGAGLSLASAGAHDELATGTQLELLLFAGSAFAALAGGQLVLQRFFLRRSSADAVLVLAFASLATAGFGSFAGLSSADPAGRATAAAATLAGAAFLAWAGFAHDRDATHRDLAAMAAAGAAVVATTLVGAAPVASVALFFAAALGFTARARSRDDVMSAGLAGAAILALYGSLDRLLLAPNGSGAGAVLALACSLLLLASATAGVRRCWEERGSDEARRTVARKLHDGLAQELALLVLEGKRREHGGGNELLLGSSERALDETRHVIATLKRPAGIPLARALADETREVAHRLRVELHLELHDVDTSDAAQDALLLIARESLIAAVEAGAQQALVTLADEDGPVLRVRHDGGASTSERSRVVESIERRACSLGANLRVVSWAESGLIEVSIP